MKFQRFAMSVSVAVAGTFALSACYYEPTQNIVGVAQSDHQLSILVEAVQAAGLDSTLSDPNAEYTVFAPTNKAFVSLLNELGLTKDELFSNQALLTEVLTYHTLGNEMRALDARFNEPVVTLNGSAIDISLHGIITDGQQRKSRITEFDHLATNGVVHVVDKVLLPPNKTIVEIAQGNPNFSILVEAVVKAGLVDTLSGDGPFTVFAPTNDAFVAALDELGISKEDLLASPNLAEILTYHVLSGRVYSSQLPAKNAATVQGETIDVTLSRGAKVTDANGRKANILATDLQGSNGVIHVIDKVILPAQ